MNLESLQILLDQVPATHKVYINTTFPVFADRTGDEMIEFVERNKDKITCINISRHLVPYVEESPDELIARIPTNTRVNCVLDRDYPRMTNLAQYMRRFKKYRIPIQFRFALYRYDTRKISMTEEHDMIQRSERILQIYRSRRLQNALRISF